jgi:hypothetical protein
LCAQLFTFAANCEAAYPVPYDFILRSLRCVGPQVSYFLVVISKRLPPESDFDPQPFVDFLLKEPDPTVTEALARFLAWTKCQLDVEGVSSKLQGPRRTAFLSHFECPFEECLPLLNVAGRVALAKGCLRAMAERGLLAEDHFNKLFPVLSMDVQGIEILSLVASRDSTLGQRLATKFFEAPLVTTDRVEIVVSGAKQLAEILPEADSISLIETGMKSDRVRRNAAIFLLYVCLHKEPERLWFTVRTLLFCCGAENGVVRTAGVLALSALYRRSSRKEEVEAAVFGKNPPPNERAQVMTGQARAQTVMAMLRIARRVDAFCDFLLASVEPEFLIFPDIEVPGPEVDGAPFAAAFYYHSFSPMEAFAETFRRLWRWSTDGGKKVSIPETVEVIDVEQEGWEAQQMNLNSIFDVIQRMTTDQMQEYLPQLATLVMKMVYSPVEKLSTAGAGLLAKMIDKCGRSLNRQTQAFIFNMSTELFDTRQIHLVLIATKWCGENLQVIGGINTCLQVWKSLFKGIGFYVSVPVLIVSDTWSVFQNACFKACELDLKLFLEMLLVMMRDTYVLDAERFGIQTALDIVLRSPKRHQLFNDVQELIPRLFVETAGERSQPVLQLRISVVYRAVVCLYQAEQFLVNYDESLLALYFTEERPDVVAGFLKQISAQSPECLRKSISPLILFASQSEQHGKEFAIILRDEIALPIQVNASPQGFVDFAWKWGIGAEKLASRPSGCKMLLAVAKVMKDEVKLQFLEMVPAILRILDDRLWPFKENLIDVLTLFVPVIPLVDDDFVRNIERQTKRQKSAYRAASFNCLLAISARRDVNLDLLLESMMDAVQNGTLVAQQAAVNCTKMVMKHPLFQKFVELMYQRIKDTELEHLDDFIGLILKLPDHVLPANFDRPAFIQGAAPVSRATSVALFLERIRQ